jgi:hypothetical protein
MAGRKRTSEPTLRTVLDRIEGQGVAIADLRVGLEGLTTGVGDLGERVDGLAANVGGMRERVDILTVRIDSQGLLLEEMRSQNSATIEAVEAVRVSLEQRIDHVDREARGRDPVLELAIRDLKLSVQQMGVDMRNLSQDVRDLSQKVDALIRIEARVSAIERRLG